MKRRLFIIEYVLLLLVPALVIGVAAFRLLGNEQERLRLAATAALEERAQAVAENIRLAMAGTEDSLLVALAALPDADLVPALKEWRDRNRLVRNVFLLDPGAGLVLPEPPQKGTGAGAASDYSEFIRRYGGLFVTEGPLSERVPESGASPKPDEAKEVAGLFPGAQGRKWDLLRMKGATVQAVVTSPSVARISASALKETVDRLPQKQSSDYEPKVRNIRQPDSALKAGWIPWTSDNTLSLLGWVQRADGQPVRGVEIDMDALLAKLAIVLPADSPAGTEYVLTDGTRSLRRLHDAAPKPGWPVCRVPVGPALPQWEVVVRAAPGAALTPDSGAFLTLSLLLTGIFLASMLTGGALLVFEAHRGRLDARRKTSFVSSVSHELKTPLTSIRMYAELLGERRVRDEEKQKRYLGIIITESQRLTRLINNVLDFSRIEQNRKVYNIAPVDVARTVRDVLDRLAVRIQEAGMYVRLELPEDGLRLHTDRDVVEQILINLVDNAMKYASAGRELRVELQPLPCGGARLRVLDRGPGIPPSAQEKVFEKFYRTDHALAGGKAGCGLGLTISRRMLRELGGDLTCGPRAGGGACFTAELKDGGRAPEPAAAKEQQTGE